MLKNGDAPVQMGASPFYRPISELDNDGGHADIFLLPLCDIVRESVKTTTLYKIVVIYRGVDMVACEEI